MDAETIGGVAMGLLILLALTEKILSHRLHTGYLRSGLPVFRHTERGTGKSSQTQSRDSIESLVAAAAGSLWKVRQASGSELVFREVPGWKSGAYQPILNGSFVVDPSSGRVEVFGRLKWWLSLVLVAAHLALVIIFVFYPGSGWLYHLTAILFVLITDVNLLWAFRKQCKAFAQLAAKVAQHLGNVPA